MAVHAFIDTNVFLAFYAYTKDDVEQLRIITQLIKTGKLKLYVPEQVVREFHRNREGKLATSMKDFRTGISAPALPRYMLDFTEVEALKNGYKALEVARAALAKAVNDAVAARSLGADVLFNDIASVAIGIPTSVDIIVAAQRRKVLGDPPGKGESHGDQIIWESLLAGVPAGTALHVISKDGDYASRFESKQIKPALVTEWQNHKQAKLHFHEELRPFLNTHFANMKLATDVEKIAAIDRLENSSNFAETHAAISALQPLKATITWSDADRLLTAGFNNSQIRWIGTDIDVNELYQFLLTSFKSNITADRLADFLEAFPAKVA